MTTPTADLHRWQARAYAFLGDLLAAGRRLDLPPLVWTLATSGAVTGEADSLSYSAAEQQEAVRGWAAHLAAEVDTRTDADGVQHLYAGWKGGVDGLVRGCLRATVRPALDAEEEGDNCALDCHGAAKCTGTARPGPASVPAPVVRPEAARYAEELRANPGTASSDGHTGWECTAGASLHVEATTPGPGRLGTLHGVIYACPEHQAAAEGRVTGGGEYRAEVSPAPASHRWDPWPCGHVTAYRTAALTALTGHQPGAQR
ncbi:hypothetical protein OG982_06215 [Streptomyces sp. NBC_01551]|uniref:hypothetical protein n=1 Tax=Streptomyces sp. NBC_01551 TaxID=2975876 RepID=UPI00224CD892|nr:hypothetical protein [Streptomyces sp. NBC_01551]MCX4525288.1 hypothetical protein [Streptomyces sp. NBC_01551]